MDRVAEALVELGATSAGIVDIGGGTWGHVRFERALLAAGLQPMFGAEMVVPTGQNRPTAWVLGEDLGQLYALTSAAHRTPTYGQPSLSPGQFATAKGVIRFAGAALDDPECFDYIDVSPKSLLSQRRALALARRTGKPMVITSENLCPLKADLDRMQVVVDRTGIGTQWLASERELRKAILFSDDDFASAVHHTHEVAERLKGSKLARAPLIQVEGDLAAVCREGQAYRLSRGHIAEWTPEYEARLQRELGLIAEKKFESYFHVVSELVIWAKERMLVGPARGSSAGSLVCYLTRITEVDPLPHGLLFERFIDTTRPDLPDIDIDFSDTHRDTVFDHLAEKYGSEHVARIGSINTFKPASAMAQAGKKLGIPIVDTFAVKNVLIEYSSGDSRYGKGLEDTLQNTAPGRAFVAKYPTAALMASIEGHASHTGVHAAGVIVCNAPVHAFCTVNGDGIAQIDKPDAEYLNLLKIDALGLRTLGIIEDSGVTTAEELYGLKLNDPAVLDVFNKRKFAGVFQFEGAAQRSVASQIQFRAFQQLDHVTALARPGPLGGGAANSYIRRDSGQAQVEYKHPSMEGYLADTLGLVLYQEQVMRIVREIGKFSWEQTTIVRKAMSGRKGAEYFDNLRKDFIAGATSGGLNDEDALSIWNEVFSFGAWGMNRSHTVSYAIISYWCAWMKHYHTLPFAAATLRSAKDDEQVVDILRELHAEGVSYVPMDPELSGSNWAAVDGKLVGGIQNAIGFGPAKAAAYIAAREAGTLTIKQRSALMEAEVKFSDLFPLHTAYGEIYRDPQGNSICKLAQGWRVMEMAEMPDDTECVIICRLLKKEQRDENEDVRAKKRNGRLLKGNTLFVDMKCIDDSTSTPITLRIDRFDWESMGETVISAAVEGKDCFLARGKKLRGFPMLKVYRLHCLTNPQMLAKVRNPERMPA